MSVCMAYSNSSLSKVWSNPTNFSGHELSQHILNFYNENSLGAKLRKTVRFRFINAAYFSESYYKCNHGLSMTILSGKIS